MCSTEHSRCLMRELLSWFWTLMIKPQIMHFMRPNCRGDSVGRQTKHKLSLLSLACLATIARTCKQTTYFRVWQNSQVLYVCCFMPDSSAFFPFGWVDKSDGNIQITILILRPGALSMFVQFSAEKNIFHTFHFLAAVSSCKGSSNLIQFNYAIKDSPSFSAATITRQDGFSSFTSSPFPSFCAV